MPRTSHQKKPRFPKAEPVFLNRSTVIAHHANGLPVMGITGPNAHFSEIELSKALEEASRVFALRGTQESKSNRK
jgi:hypothetical protein